jgi:hypothetical protein
MPLRLTYERAMRVMQQVRDEAAAERSIAGRMDPNLIKPKPEDDQPKREPPIMGWSHLKKK